MAAIWVRLTEAQADAICAAASNTLDDLGTATAVLGSYNSVKAAMRAYSLIGRARVERLSPPRLRLTAQELEAVREAVAFRLSGEIDNYETSRDVLERASEKL